MILLFAERLENLSLCRAFFRQNSRGQVTSWKKPLTRPVYEFYKGGRVTCTVFALVVKGYMFGYLAFLAPAIFNTGESKDFDCDHDLTNDHELPEIPSMNAFIIQQK